MARRLGVKAMMSTARNFCRLWTTYGVGLMTLFGASAPLIIAGEALNLACAVFVQEAMNAIEPGT
jgi:hypothetical protein